MWQVFICNLLSHDNYSNGNCLVIVSTTGAKYNITCKLSEQQCLHTFTDRHHCWFYCSFNVVPFRCIYSHNIYTCFNVLYANMSLTSDIFFFYTIKLLMLHVLNYLLWILIHGQYKEELISWVVCSQQSYHIMNIYL